MNSRVFPKGMAFEMLEPCAAKVACEVLRGLGVGNNPRLPDSSVFSVYHKHLTNSLQFFQLVNGKVIFQNPPICWGHGIDNM